MDQNLFRVDESIFPHHKFGHQVAEIDSETKGASLYVAL